MVCHATYDQEADDGCAPANKKREPQWNLFGGEIEARRRGIVDARTPGTNGPLVSNLSYQNESNHITTGWVKYQDKFHAIPFAGELFCSASVQAVKKHTHVLESIEQWFEQLQYQLPMVWTARLQSELVRLVFGWLLRATSPLLLAIVTVTHLLLFLSLRLLFLLFIVRGIH
jgi:hypothetical protein